MTTWMPAIASFLALIGVALFFAYDGNDCTHCTTPQSPVSAEGRLSFL